MNSHAIQWLGIDVLTVDAEKLLARLKKLNSTKDSKGPHAYREDPAYSQIRIRTAMNEDQLDNWLYSVKHGAEYIGTFNAESPDNKESDVITQPATQPD